MARTDKKLSPRAVETIAKVGRHSDGNGLYLVVDASGARRWLYMFRWEGKLKEMGLGGFPAVSLAKARAKAQAAREVRDEGKNPIAERRASEAQRVTFGEFADELVAGLQAQWRNEKHRAQWTMTLREYAAPLRPLTLDAITTEHVLAVLKPIWTTKAETAARLRGRIERVLDAAKARGLRSGENPARWRGHLDHLLPKRQKLTRGHHAALPYSRLPAFVAELRERRAPAGRALEFLVLTAARTSEVLGARWCEIDLEGKVWTVPADRMKAGREHRVPLSARALELVSAGGAPGELVFPGKVVGSPLSTGAMERVLDRMGYGSGDGAPGYTVHGFRSTFRDWAGEASTFPRELAEAALAHTVGDETERAYRRGDALEKRRKLMDAWARYVDASIAATVVPMRRPA